MSEKKRVLVIDDDPLVSKVIERVLERRGCEAVKVSDGQEAQQAIVREGSAFSLAILDLLLPHGPTGWDMLDFIRENAETMHLPVMVITGAKVSEEERKRLKEKANAIVQKQDFSIESFSKLLDELLETCSS